MAAAVFTSVPFTITGPSRYRVLLFSSQVMTGFSGTSSGLTVELHGQDWIAAKSCCFWAAGIARTASGVLGGVKPTIFHWSIGPLLAAPDGDAEGLADPDGLVSGVAEPLGVGVLLGLAAAFGCP